VIRSVEEFTRKYFPDTEPRPKKKTGEDLVPAGVGEAFGTDLFKQVTAELARERK
jgi:hypothetical protein